MPYSTTPVDERVTEVLEISEAATLEIAAAIASNCDISCLEQNALIVISNTLLTHLQRGVLEAIRAVERGKR